MSNEKKTVMIVDDSALSARVLKDMVEKKEYEVTAVAGDGEKAVELYDEVKPDISIIDIVLPGMTGLETAEVILRKNKDARIIMTSSLCDDETLAEVHKLGLKFLIPKPCDPDLLTAALNMIGV